MSVNDVFKGMGAGFCVSGRVETGMVQPGDKVLVSPLGETAVIKGLNHFHHYSVLYSKENRSTSISSFFLSIF